MKTLPSLVKEAGRRGVRLPSQATVVKYGMTLHSWLSRLDEQGWECPICHKAKERYVTDHEHVSRWRQMDPENRRKYVRGLTCTGCNHWVLTRFATAERHEAAAAYLRKYNERRLRDS